MNNSAGSELTFSGFSNLTFSSATSQTQDKADSAIYVGPKTTVTPPIPPPANSEASGGSQDSSSENTEPKGEENQSEDRGSESKVNGGESTTTVVEPAASATLWRITSDTSVANADVSDNPSTTGVNSAGNSVHPEIKVGKDAGENSISEEKTKEASAPATTSPSITFKDNVDITFENNSSKKAGGAINVNGGTGKIENNTGTCTFSKNNAKEQGGAISITGNFDITGNKTVVFSGNKAQVISSPAQETEGKAAEVTEQEVPAVTTGTGGAIHYLAAPTTSEPGISGQPSGQTEIPSSSVQAILLSADIPAPTPVKKQQEPAPAEDPCLTISGSTSVTFTNNSSTTSGGAIHAKKLVLSSGGDITFSNNSSGKGGAIFITDGGDISITAETGSITFQGNTVTSADDIILPSKTPETGEKANKEQPNAALALIASKASAKAVAANQNQKPTHNAIHLGSGAKISQLRAGTGQTIFFYDPITMATASSSSQSPAKPSIPDSSIRAAAVSAPAPAVTPKTPLKINASDSNATTVYNGTIVFSGEKLSTEAAANPLNATSVFDTSVSLEAGTLVLKSGAGLIVDSFTQQEGSLIVMDGGTSIITRVPTTASPAPKATLAAEALPVVRALTKCTDPKVVSELVASSLMNFKQRGPSAATPANPGVSASQTQAADGSITITNLAVNLDSLGDGKMITLTASGTGNITLSGDLQFQDSSQNFYDNPLLNKNFSANILDISTNGSGKIETNNFNMIPQGSTSSNVGYQGKWEVIQTTDTSGKVSFELKWIASGYTPPPTRNAPLVPNSLWCSAIDMRAIQNLVEVSAQN
ncbi:outer membrane protein [Chlamydia felis Fe/C-56]|uniref:Outer membrane protein n=1 Tax=Chlamydia felis (strain Fe/C-56) TaxID=264202 RepID=Q253P7_CHLFF|nr:outer membrane protein [Chlamydia felis Fe/C-56]